MNIHINHFINNKLDKNDIKINIESSSSNNEIQNIIQYINEFDNKKIIVFDGYDMIEIFVKDILYFYSEGNYNFCKTINKKYRIKSKLYEIDKKSKDFLRISKSCVINIKKVKSFNVGINRSLIVKFYDDSEQTVARRKIKEVMNYLDERMI